MSSRQMRRGMTFSNCEDPFGLFAGNPGVAPRIIRGVRSQRPPRSGTQV